MKKAYDFSKGERGKFFRPNAELNLPVYLEPDVAKAFRNSAAVNEALRSLLRISATTRRLTKSADESEGSSRR
ncbi:MAG: hypothetical protein ACLQVG_31080 [Terriglobia bacterium]